MTNSFVWMLAGLVTLATASISLAHEHMYVASTSRRGGQLVVEYDFARAFPLAELANRPGTWLGVDPSIKPLANDEPDRSRFRLRNGTKLSLEIISLDPAVSVGLANKTLAQPNQRAVAGKMPYLHVHPQWTLTLPAGTSGEGRVSFRLHAPGYKVSPVYDAVMAAVPPPTTTTTSTTTTTGDGTTTTSTLPLCTAVSCDDHDPCTADLCEGTSCTHVVATEADAVLCRLRGFQSVLDEETPATRKARKVLGRLYRSVNRAREATQAARAQATPKLVRQAGKNISRLTSIVDIADRASVVDPTRIAALLDLAAAAYDAFTLWQPGT